MSIEKSRPGQGPSEILSAAEGTGPLLERDYWAVIEGTGKTPEEIVEMVRARFPDFAPPQTASFRPADGEGDLLDLGSEMDICIALAGNCKVRLVHRDARSLTLRTLEGHPEAGRITFGADRDEQGRLIFRIRSRTRAGGILKYLGFLVLGKQMQSKTWIRFIHGVAEASGGRVREAVHVRTSRVEDQVADRTALDAPTFVGKGTD